MIVYSDCTVMRNDTQFSYRKTLYWKEVPKTAQGNYTCIAFNQSMNYSESWFLNVENITEPRILHTNSSQFEVEKYRSRTLGQPLQLTCNFSGDRQPMIRWYRDGSIIPKNSDDGRVRLLKNDTVLEVKKFETKDEAIYKCVASNKMGNDSQEFDLNIATGSGLTNIIG